MYLLTFMFKTDEVSEETIQALENHLLESYNTYTVSLKVTCEGTNKETNELLFSSLSAYEVLTNNPSKDLESIGEIVKDITQSYYHKVE